MKSRRTRTLIVPLLIAAAVLAVTEGAAGTTHRTNGLLVYRVQVGKHSQLFTIRPDGTGPTQITHFTDSDATWPKWSPDGTRIAFERDFATHAGIYTMNPDGSDVESLTPHGFNGEPSWSPNGKRITFGRYIPNKEASIWVMNADGSNVRRVTKYLLPKNDGCGGCAGQGASVFSPDGKRLAFTWIKGERSGAIYVVGVDGKGLRQVTPFGRGVADVIDWSPDGTRLAFSSPEFGRPGKSSNVSVIRPDGTGLRQITHEKGGTVNDGFDSWSPDGTQMAFVSNRDGAYEIYLMHADGTNITPLTQGPEAHQANWGSAG
jgi:TolB protein